MDRTISGYIRISVLSDNDYNDIIREIKKTDFKIDRMKTEDEIYNELYYKLDLFLLKYYSCYSKSGNSEHKEKVKLKLRYLFDKITTAYPQFYKAQDIQEFNLLFDMPPGYITKNLFDALIQSGYPHQVFAFCFRSLIDNWSIDKMVLELSEDKLDNIYNIFTNEYSSQSGLPTFLISLYFLKMQNKLNQKLKYIISNKDSVTLQKLENYTDMVTGLTHLDYYYSNNSYHDISEWCNKVKRKTVKTLVGILDK